MRTAPRLEFRARRTRARTRDSSAIASAPRAPRPETAPTGHRPSSAVGSAPFSEWAC